MVSGEVTLWHVLGVALLLTVSGLSFVATYSLTPLLVCLVFDWISFYVASLWAGVIIIAHLVHLLMKFHVVPRLQEWIEKVAGQ